MCRPEFLSFHGGKFASGAAGHLPLSDYWSICVPGMLVLKRKASEGIPVVFQSLGRVQLFATPWTAACQASLSFTISRSLLKFTSIELMMPSDHLIVCHLLLPSVFPTIRVFSSESAPHIWWPKYWSFSVSPSSEYSRLISFKIDWFDFLAVQRTLKSFPAPQFKSINSSALCLLYGPILTSIHDY